MRLDVSTKPDRGMVLSALMVIYLSPKYKHLIIDGDRDVLLGNTAPVKDASKSCRGLLKDVHEDILMALFITSDKTMVYYELFLLSILEQCKITQLRDGEGLQYITDSGETYSVLMSYFEMANV